MGIDLNPEAVRSALPRFAFVSRLHRRLLGRQISGDLLTSLFRPSFALPRPNQIAKGGPWAVRGESV